MSLKTNPYYIAYHNGVGMVVSNAHITLSHSEDPALVEHAREFIKWLDKEVNKRYTYENRKGKHRK